MTNNHNLDFEVKASTVGEAKARVEEIRAEFGEDAYITITLVEDKANQIMQQLAANLNSLQAKIGGIKE